MGIERGIKNTVCLEDLGLIHSTHMVANNHCNYSSRGSNAFVQLLWDQTCIWYTDICSGKTLILI